MRHGISGKQASALAIIAFMLAGASFVVNRSPTVVHPPITGDCSGSPNQFVITIALSGITCFNLFATANIWTALQQFNSGIRIGSSGFYLKLDGNSNLGLYNPSNVEIINIPNTGDFNIMCGAVNCITLQGGTGLMSKYNSKVTAGNGIPAIYAATAQKSETGADASVLSYTPPASAGTYRACIVMDTTSGVSGSLGWTMTWKDNNGNPHAPPNLAETGENAVPSLTFTVNGAAAISGCWTFDINNSQTPIVIKTTLASGTASYTVSATLVQLQ